MKYCVPKRWDKVLHDQRGTKFPRQDHLQKTAKFQTSTGDQNNNARAWSPSAVGQLDGQLGQAIFISLIFLPRELLRVDMFVSLGKGMMTSSQSPKPSTVISGQDSPGPAFSVIGFVCLCGFKWKYQQKLHTSASLPWKSEVWSGNTLAVEAPQEMEHLRAGQLPEAGWQRREVSGHVEKCWLELGHAFTTQEFRWKALRIVKLKGWTQPQPWQEITARAGALLMLQKSDGNIWLVDIILSCPGQITVIRGWGAGVPSFVQCLRLLETIWKSWKLFGSLIFLGSWTSGYSRRLLKLLETLETLRYFWVCGDFWNLIGS